MYKVLISDKLPESAVEILEKDSNYDVTVKTDLSPAQIIALIPGYHALLVRSATKVTAELIDSATSLKIIGRAGTGLDNIDVKYANSKGVEVVNTPGSNSRAVAELTIAMLLSLSRNLYLASYGMKNHRWDKAQLIGSEILGKTLGLIGFGKISQEVGKLASGLGMNILVYKPSPMTKSPGYEFEMVSFDELLAKSDFVSLHLPKTEQTTNLIALRELKKMKKSAYLVNCARGGIVHESDLLKALNEGSIAGAALDVFYSEPPQEYSLIDHEKVLVTPHIGASTKESQERVGKDIVESVMNFLETKYVFINRE